MALQNTQYDAIMREYDRKQLHNRHVLDERTTQIYDEIPRIAEIQQEMASLSAARARALLQGEPSGIAYFQSSLKKLSEEKRTLLVSNGYPADYLEPLYECPICKDTGYVDGEKCACFQQAAISLLYKQSNIQKILEKENFQTFSFDYYSDKIADESTGKSALWLAHFAVRKSMEFIDHFSERGGNLFIYGDTGVGKTFLSHCIAYELIQRGISVLYFSAYDLFQMLAEQTFGREESQSALRMDSICQADLLIIDDLGTELTNTFVKTQLFAVLNERLLCGKSTIISTNFDMETFSNTYTTRIFSRIMQNFTLLNLIGQDIRVQKTLGGNNHETK